MYFTADNGTNGYELWKFDGTTATLIDINLVGPSFPESLVVFAGNLYFSANAADGNGKELWKYNGTNATFVQDINPGANGSDLEEFTVIGSDLYFTANDGINGKELWKFNGTTATLVQDINAGSASSNPRNITAYGGKVYFSAAGDNLNGKELWSYDGTVATMVANIHPTEDSNPFDLVVCDGNLYFSAIDNNLTGEYRLRKYNGTTLTVADSSDSYNLTVVGNDLYYTSYKVFTGSELWKINGTNLSINNFVSSQEVVIYPNPSSSTIHIESNLKIESVKILDFFGKTSKVNLNSNNIIDISHLSKGVYILQLQTKDSLLNKKFVKE